MLSTLNISPLSNTFPVEPVHNNLTVVDVKFESSTSMETLGSTARTGFDPNPPANHLDDSGSLNTPTASPPGGDLGVSSNKRKRSVPKKVSVDEDNNPMEGDMGDEETVVKTEELDFSMQSYEDIAAPDPGCDWVDIAPPSPSEEMAQIELARQGAQKANSQQREDCPICGDKANGLHYGVYTCEGCKNFFKRSVVVTQKKPYICTYDNACDVRIVIDMSGIKRKGARCQACRYSACLNAGMYHSGYPRSRGGRHSKAPPRQGGQEWVDMITGYLPQPGQKSQQQHPPQQQESPEPKKAKTVPTTPSSSLEMLEQQMGLVQEEVDQSREEQLECESSQVMGKCEEMVNSVWRNELEIERSKNREMGSRLEEKEKQLNLVENQVETMKQHMMTSQSLVEQQADEIKRLKQEIGRLGFFRNSANHYRQSSNGNTCVQNGNVEEEDLLIPADMLDVSFKE